MIQDICKRKMLLLRALRYRGDVYCIVGRYSDGKEDYKKAISICKNDDQISSSLTARTLIGLADIIARSEGDYERAEHLIKQAIGGKCQKEHPKIYASGLNYLGTISFHKGDYDKALKYQQKSLKLYKELSDKENTVEVYTSIGLIYQHKGKLETSLRYYTKAISILKEQHCRNRISAISINIGTVYYDKGEPDIALRYYKKHLSLSKKIGHKMGIGIALGNIGNVFLDRGDFDTALNLFRKCLDIFEEIGYKIGIILATANIGLTHCDKGEPNIALKYYKRNLALSNKTGFKMGTGIAYSGFGIIYRDTGNPNLSKKYLEKAEEIFRDMEDKINLSWIYSHLSELNITQENYKKAYSYAEKALSYAKETGAMKEKILALRVMGKVLAREHPEKAISYLKKSIILSEKKNKKFEYAKSLFELARVQQITGNTKTAEKHLKEAKKILTKRGVRSSLLT